MTTAEQTNQQIIDRHDKYMSINYGRFPIAMVRGEGALLFDADGQRYIDLFAGFGAGLLGHCHPELADAVAEQARTLWHAGNLFHTEPQTRLAEAIHHAGFPGRCFFCHSGADANEAAIKLSRLYGRARPGREGPRYGVISAHRSFHGRTFGTMPATGQPAVSEGFDPLPPGYTHVAFNDLGAIESAIDAKTVAVLLEPIQGEGGVNIPDDGYLAGLRALCDERDLLMICDEVWTGGGRTGRYFAHQHWHVTPDVMTLAKGVGGGLPVGVCCIREKHAELFDWRKYGRAVHATTLGGNAICMAAAARVFEVIERDGLVQRAADLGERVMSRMRLFAEQCPAIRLVRGKGLYIGIELDPSADGAWFESGSDVVKAALKQGVYINATQQTVLRLAPALNIDEDLLDRGLSVLEGVIRG